MSYMRFISFFFPAKKADNLLFANTFIEIKAIFSFKGDNVTWLLLVYTWISLDPIFLYRCLLFLGKAITPEYTRPVAM